MTEHDKWGVDLSTLTQEEFDEWMTSECDSGTGTQEPEGGGVTKRVLGLDLSKVGLGQALEAMAEAWLDAQGVEEIERVPQVAMVPLARVLELEGQLWA